MNKFQLNPDNPDNFLIIRNIGQCIRALDPSKKWEVTIKQYRRNTSQEQRGYWWGLVLPTIKEWLHETRGVLSTEQGLHDELKDIYIPYTYEQGMSGDRKVYKSTSDLDAVEFADICTKIAADFAEQGLHIPPPDRNWKSIKRAG